MYGAANMVRSLAHRIYKIMLRELKLFSLVKRWLRRDITQILTPQRAVMKMWSFSNSNITNIHHHKLQPCEPQAEHHENVFFYERRTMWKCDTE